MGDQKIFFIVKSGVLSKLLLLLKTPGILNRDTQTEFSLMKLGQPRDPSIDRCIIVIVF